MMKKEYDISPTPKPRMTQRDKWNPSDPALRYFAFKDECRLKKVELPNFGAHVTFIIPFPKSYTLKKRKALDGEPHTQKPDVDNLGKALMDAVHDDDSGVYDIRVTKLWGYSGSIIVNESCSGREESDLSGVLSLANAAEIAAAERFHETIHDNGTYDIPVAVCDRLVDLGLAVNPDVDFYYETDLMLTLIEHQER